MQYKVHFLPSDITISVEDGATIMDAERNAELSYEYPCGGNGTCGKCLVTVTDSEGRVRRVKCCTTKVCGNITVDLGSNESLHNEKVMTEFADNNLSKNKSPLNPGIKVLKITMPEASVGNVNSDFSRFANVCKDMGLVDDVAMIKYNSMSTLSSLSETLAKDIFTFNAVFYENTLLDIRTDEFTPLGVAFDIGTTTIACYIMSLRTGKELANVGELNNQVKYGNDVISRCIYATTIDFNEIHSCVTNQLSNMIKSTVDSLQINSKDVYGISIVGNTCMHHIFAGIMPHSLINVPYTPAVKERMILKANDYFKGTVNSNALILLLPVIAGFIGADTVGAMLATDFTSKEKITLLLDIGTNGEMVLGNNSRYVTCSTASGPAFEGAKITCGMRGAPGAIDHVFMENGDLNFTTIDQKQPIGICGSGLVDAVALMLNEQVIIPSGRFNKKLDNTSPLYKRMYEDENGKCFKISDKVFVTQKDIREVQLAKGAIAAGIEIMSETIGCKYEDINEVLIAGAFGNYMKPQSMCKLKMIPEELINKIVSVGNAAGAGAKLSLISNEDYIHTGKISKDAQFIELATHEHFQEKFIKQLDF